MKALTKPRVTKRLSTALALLLALVSFVATPLTVLAEETNRNEVRAGIAQGDWQVVYGDLINEADYAEFVLAVAAAVASENPAPIYAFFDAQLEAQLAKIEQTAPEIAGQALVDLLLRAFDSQGQVFRNGRLELSAGVATYKRWERVVYDEPRTYRCKQDLPFPPGAWTWSICTTTERVEKIVPYPNNFQPYIRFRWIASGQSGQSGQSGGHDFYFRNNCSKPIRLMLRYKQLSGEWRTQGWYNFDGNEASYLNAEPGVRLRSNNSVFYYYAESTDGRTSVWSGDETREFNGESWPMKRKELTLDSDGDWSLGIRCDG